MNAANLVLVRPERKRCAEAVYDLTAKCFGHHGYWSWTASCRRWYFRKPYDWSASTIGLIDGRVVTHWGVWDIAMRIGSAAVRMAGIGAVATDGSMRKCGLMARTAAAGIDAAAQAGYDATLLYGIGDFYHRFGYVRAWSSQATVVRTSDLPALPAEQRLRSFTPRHRDDLAELYNRYAAGLTGTAERPTFVTRGRGGELNGALWLDARRRLEGYIVFEAHHGHLELIDSAGPAEMILAALRATAEKKRLAEVRMPNLHGAGELSRLVRRGNCRIETHCQRSGGPMIRTLNLAAMLGKLAGEFALRLRRSPMAGWTGTLVLADPREAAALAFDKRTCRVSAAAKTKHAIRGGEQIAQLLIGTDEPRRIAEDANMTLSGDAPRLLDALFPAQQPTLGTWDMF